MAATFDCYRILGVGKQATKDEIRKAYKKLAKKHHPDANADDPEALQKFKDVQRAWDILSDDEKRRNFDQYGTPEAPRFTQGHGDVGGDQQSWAWSPGGDEVPFDIEDLFSGFRSRQGGRGGGGERSAWPVRGHDFRADIQIPFTLAAEGGRYELRLPGDAAAPPKTLVVTIPAGIDSGSVIRLAGEGGPGINQGEPGDLLVSVTIAPHAWFKRDGANILLDVPISITECALGVKVDIPTLSDGTVILTIPPGTSSGAKLRLKEKGLRDRRTGKRGDMLAVVKVVPPKQPDERSRELLQELDHALQQKPRSGLWGQSVGG